MAIADSYVAPTNMERLWAVLRKAARGESIRIAALGGSITGGANATALGNRWVNLSANWFLDRYGVDAQTRLINAGIGSTESPYGALRVVQQVLSYQPDLIFLDYSVNNAPTDLASYESLVRKLLEWKPAAAIIPVQFCNAIGQGQGESLIAVAQEYGLGSVSYQRAMLVYLAGGGLPTDYSDDTVHPTNAGHALAASYVWNFLDQVKAALEERRATAAAPPADNSFERTSFIERASLPTAFSSGFAYDPATIRYRSTVAGSFAEWRINVGGEGKIWVAAGISNDAQNGVIAAFLDDVAQSTTPTRDLAWSFNRIELFQIATDVAPGPHRLRLITGAGDSGALVDLYGVGFTVD